MIERLVFGANHAHQGRYEYQLRHQLSTYIFVAPVVRDSLSTHTLGIIAARAVPQFLFKEASSQAQEAEQGDAIRDMSSSPRAAPD